MSTRDLISLSDLVGGIGRLLVSRGRLVPKALKILGERDATKRESIGTLLERNAIENPTQAAIKYGEREISHHEFNSWVNRYANYWISIGVKKGDVAAIFMENRPELLVAVAALAKIGAIAGMVNTQQRKHVLVHSFTTCKPKLYVIGEELREPFEEIRAELGEIPQECLFYSPDLGERVHGVRVVFPPPRIEDNAPPGYLDIECASQDSAATNPKTTKEVQLQDPCFYIFTSGTTGLPKASIMTHFRWVKAGGIMGMAALHLGIDDTLYAPLPLYHNQALTTSWASTASTGACLAIRRRFSASSFWEDARNFNATAFTYIGEVCPYLLAQPPHDDDRKHTITRCMGVGMRPEVWHEFKRRFGIDEIYEFYAASECNIAFINLLNFDRTVGVCPLPYALVKFDVDAGEPVLGPDGFMQRIGKGEAGLLLAEVSEKAKFDGYTDPAASEKKLFRNVFKTGDVWFNSGDLLRDLGFKHAQFVDRVGDT
ncbi:MAG: AMP-binding protein, partial [Myxococcales bacterium]|nr:AMP-binding protein [Myxococcales bacterium]